MRTLSHDLEKHEAGGKLVALTEAHDLDVLCVHEASTPDLPAELGPLHLADATATNRLGLAIHHRRNRYEIDETQTHRLRRGLHDLVAAPAHERLLAARRRDVEHGREVHVASFHASPLTAPDTLRRHRIAAAHTFMRDLGPGLPALMVGGCNHPVGLADLARRLLRDGYDLTSSDAHTHTRYRFVRGHLDFATSIGMRIDGARTLPQGRSNHAPIVVTSTDGRA